MQNESAMARQIQKPVREVIYRTRGRTSGPITRLVSPSDLGELIKPFVFLDLAVFDGGPRTPMEHFWHPHSGIATVTVMLEGGVRFAETSGKQGRLPKGSIIGSASKHPHDLVLGNYSVHTSEAALGQGESEIRRIREELHT